MEHNNDNTAAVASIKDMADCTVRADAQVRSVLQGVMAQRRSAAVAFGYVAALSPGTKANCWSIAESAGHEGWGRMQGLLGSYRWDWQELRAALEHCERANAGAPIWPRRGSRAGPVT